MHAAAENFFWRLALAIWVGFFLVTVGSGRLPWLGAPEANKVWFESIQFEFQKDLTVRLSLLARLHLHLHHENDLFEAYLSKP